MTRLTHSLQVIAPNGLEDGNVSNVVRVIRDALVAGLNTEALDLTRSAVFHDDHSVELHYLGALASARIGAIDEAETWLGKIDRGQLDNSPLTTEVWSLAGRIAKERFSAARNKTSVAAREHARGAIAAYQRAFDIGGSPYPAVNAATMATLVGDLTLGQTLARRALSRLAGPGDHWHHATAGEAHLLVGEVNEVRAHYAEAYRLAGNRFGDIAAMRRQLLLIGSSAAIELLDAIPTPHVIAFSGHMIDHPNRATPRFPPSLEPKVAFALREKLAGLTPAIGYAQAACGADILFLESLQDSGMQTNIVLPFAQADFVKTSVSFAGEEWVARFERVLDRASRVVLATEEAYLSDRVLFEHATHLIHGMAFLQAMELCTQPLLLNVLDSASAERAGGTAANAQVWAREGGQIENIDLAALRTDQLSVRTFDDEDIATWPSEQSGRRRSLKSLLFADVSGYSRVPEPYTPLFVETFWGTCKAILDSLENPAADANTAGDGLYLVFELPRHAAEFAVRLQTALRQIDWPALGLSPDTSARIGLHTGPVFRTFDPVMGKKTFSGTHVNRTARLEPIVRPGHIFCTEAFAASLAANECGPFSCHYIGVMPLAKQFGEARLYRLRSTIDD